MLSAKYHRDFAVALAAGGSLVFLLFLSKDQRYLAVPACLAILLVIWLWVTLWRRDLTIPLFDAGMICAVASLVYTVFPLVNYWAGGLKFGPLSDLRLQTYSITPAELGSFHFRHVIYLASFVLVYAACRGKGSIRLGKIASPSPSVRHVIVFVFFLLTTYFIILQIFTGVNFNTSYQSDVYAEFLSAMNSLPLLLLQVSVKIWGILFIFKIALLFVVIRRCAELKWRMILFAWILLEIVQGTINKGARVGLILFIMAAVLIYHRLIKPFSLRTLTLVSALALSGFLFLGIYRSYFSVSEMKVDFVQRNSSFLAATNEFQALLGTEYDVLQRKEAGANLPWYLYLNDFMAILPPRQIMPFEKIGASEWYLREIGLSGTGLGYMWGVISQSIIGLDWIELILRGAILGYILARFHRWFLRHQIGFLENMLYVFICLKIYYTFRDTTFSLLANIIWEIIPAYFVIRIGAIVFRKEKKPIRPFPRGQAAGGV